MRNHNKHPHVSIEDKAHAIFQHAVSGQSDKLLSELNSIKPKDLSKLTAKLQEEQSKVGNKGHLPEVKVTQLANTKEGGLQQPIQLSFESKSNKADRAQVFSYNVLKHQWYHSELDTKARAVELYALDGKPAKVIDTLNTVKSKDFSELERKLNEQTSQFTLGSEVLPTPEITKRDIILGAMQPAEITLNNKSDYHSHVYQYDTLRHKWQENKRLSSNKSLQRLGSSWQFQMSETKRMFGQAGKDMATGTDWCYRFFIKMEGITKGLEELSGGQKKR